LLIDAKFAKLLFANPAHANLKITTRRGRDFQLAGSSLRFDVLITN